MSHERKLPSIDFDKYQPLLVIFHEKNILTQS